MQSGQTKKNAQENVLPEPGATGLNRAEFMERAISLLETPACSGTAFWPTPGDPVVFLENCLSRAGQACRRIGPPPGLNEDRQLPLWAAALDDGPLLVGWDIPARVRKTLDEAGRRWLSLRCCPWEYGKWVVEAHANFPLPTSLPALPPYEVRGARRLQMLENAVLLLPDPPSRVDELTFAGRSLSWREPEILALYSSFAMVVIHHSFVADARMSCVMFDLGVQVRFDPLEFLLISPELRGLAGADPLIQTLSRARSLADVVWEKGDCGALVRTRRLATRSFWAPLLEEKP